MFAKLHTPAPSSIISGFIAIVATAALPFMVPSVHAATIDNSDTPRVEVHFADLNLDTPQGRAKLAQRISGAADQVCGVETSRIDYMRCRDAAVSRANRELAARALAGHLAAR